MTNALNRFKIKYAYAYHYKDDSGIMHYKRIQARNARQAAKLALKPIYKANAAYKGNHYLYTEIKFYRGYSLKFPAKYNISLKPRGLPAKDAWLSKNYLHKYKHI